VGESVVALMVRHWIEGGGYVEEGIFVGLKGCCCRVVRNLKGMEESNFGRGDEAGNINMRLIRVEL
jgi:hypothetical protein